MTTTNALPEVDADNMVGIAFVLTRSAVPGLIDLYQVVCPMQGAPKRLNHVGSFSPTDLLDWGYAGKLCESGQFEAWPLWDFMAEMTGLDPTEMLAWRPMLGTNLEALQVLANMEASYLLALFPPLLRAA